VPSVLLEPGGTPRPSSSDDAAVAPVALGSPTTPQRAGLVEDTRLAFRVALELCEGPTPPRVTPQRTIAALQAAAAAAATAATPAPTAPFGGPTRRAGGATSAGALAARRPGSGVTISSGTSAMAKTTATPAAPSASSTPSPPPDPP
jgi:hypothetical protein